MQGKVAHLLRPSLCELCNDAGREKCRRSAFVRLLVILNLQSHRQLENRAVHQTPTTRRDPVINSSGGSASVRSKQLLLYL